MYHENCLKNHAGTFKQVHIVSKTVPIYCVCSELQHPRCHVCLLDLYISKLPETATSKDLFYVRPLTQKPVTASLPWYAALPVGKNTLSSMMKRMCTAACIEGHKTNHSLRASGTTELFQAQVPEKVIQERTGHRSLTCMNEQLMNNIAMYRLYLLHLVHLIPKLTRLLMLSCTRHHHHFQLQRLKLIFRV